MLERKKLSKYLAAILMASSRADSQLRRGEEDEESDGDGDELWHLQMAESASLEREENDCDEEWRRRGDE